ncbi:MAG: SDR family NAD(P)-dependent oxidoreductase [Burkholderia sp.]
MRAAPSTALGERVRAAILDSLAQALAIARDAVEPDVPFADYGVDSILGVGFVQQINGALGLALNTTVLFDHTTAERLAVHIETSQRDRLAADGRAAQARIEGAARSHAACREPAAHVLARADAMAPVERVRQAVLDGLAEVVGVERDAIDEHLPFSDYGVDSILGVGFVQRINQTLGLALNTTVLFDHASVARLVAHVVAQHAGRLAAVPAPGDAVPPRAVADHAAVARPAATRDDSAARSPAPAPVDGIAIVGLSGQFPGARDADELWRNMTTGVDPVTELPPAYLAPDAYHPDKQPGRSYCKWGGVLAERDCFDPMFFNLSPRDAESMNPHQRLILQESWRALEDAGYDPSGFADGRLGVFVGAEPSGYWHETFTGASDAIVASRLSYFLDLKGPALVVNTGCSSSAVALHLACESLRSGETRVALAGGVFAAMGQSILVGLAQTDMLTHRGRCASFDADADGMVMSEGVGMVLLKPLADAVADGDAIYGVIRASGANQDGASNGITAPSGAAQEALIVDVYRRYAIDPARISYVETHGTGTRLGDPVEANALVRAFRHFTDQSGYCAVGSVKSHIGHTSSASGVIGLISLLMCLRHRRLPALRHFRTLNPLIEFDGSPFFPLSEWRAWASPDGVPRMAALNSFGHSGTNVHVVVEEWTGDAPPTARADGDALILLSARDPARLREVAVNLRDAVRDPSHAAALADIAHTLRVGREAMACRLALVVANTGALADALDAWLAARDAGARIWCGEIEPGRARQRRAPDPARTARVDRALDAADWDALAAAWIDGMRIDWARLRHDGPPPRRVHLPSYPFARERYWRPASDAAAPDTALHPLVQRNVSTLGCTRFATTLTGAEPCLTDHVVASRSVLPGVAHLEMARAAIELALGQREGVPRLRLEDVVWVRPLVVTSPVALVVEVRETMPGVLAYRIGARDADGGEQLHSQGRASTALHDAPAPLDLAALGERIAGTAVTAEACYAALEAAGVHCGPAHRALHALTTGEAEVLAELRLPAVVQAQAGAYVLHPSMLDAALQASVALSLSTTGGAPAALPFALTSLDIYGPCHGEAWVWIRFAPAEPDGGPRRLDIDLCDARGEVCAQLRGLTSRDSGGDPQSRPDGRASTLRVPQAHADGACLRMRIDAATPLLRDHSGIVPAAMLVEVARAAADRRAGRIVELADVIWPRPLLADPARGDARAVLRFDDAAQTFTLTGDGDEVVCQGRAVHAGAPAASEVVFDVDAIARRCPVTLDAAACDARLAGTHGPSLLSLRALRHGEDEALATLALPDAWHDGETHDAHPVMLNGAMLAGVVWSLLGRADTRLPMPFGVARIVLRRPLGAHATAYLRRSRDAEAAGPRATLDIDLLDEAGRSAVSLERLTLVYPQQRDALVFAAPVWRARALPRVAGTGATPFVVLAGDQPAVAQALRRAWPTARIETLPSPGDAPAPAVQRAVQCLIDAVQAALASRDGDFAPWLVLLPDDGRHWAYGALAGLLKTIRLEHARIVTRLVRHRAHDEPAATALVAALATECAAAHEPVEVRYDADGGREVAALVEATPAGTALDGPTFRAGDVVWITGGLGGIGRRIARHLGLARGVRIALSGRSPLAGDGAAFVAQLERDGVQVLYVEADAAEPASVARALAAIERRFGALNGVVHSAGVIDDDYLANKRPEQVARVLRAKVDAAWVLDAATRAHRLDYFVVFSSIAGALGNPGQADYAAANAFLDSFAAWRDAEVRAGRGSGRTVSLNWPLWRDGGMQMGRHGEALMQQATGMVAMDSASGCEAFERCLRGDGAQWLVAFGHPAAIRRGLLGLRDDAPEVAVAPDRHAADGAGAARAPEDDAALVKALGAALIRLVAQIQRIPLDKIRLTRELSDYGFDSIRFTEFSNALNARYGLTLMPTLFFEIADLASLADHLIARHRDAIAARHADQPTAPLAMAASAPRAHAAAVPTGDAARAAEAAGVSVPPAPDNPADAASARADAAISSTAAFDTAPPTASLASDAIAVIGIGGRFPGATDLDDLWGKLRDNADLIDEVPASRWDWRAIHGDPHREPGKTRVKWGGFVTDADCFDARFFGISPAEAETLDPQLRLFLETTWATLEDAGYRASALAGSRTGVFAGVSTSDYKDLLNEARGCGALSTPAEPFPFMVANRVSYWFNFRGPSESIDTACSSSLIALHRAVESLRLGHCDLAIAGGASLLAHPRITIASSQAGMLSEDGRCMTFDARANGYVRSEGVAAVLLKPLARALADGDPIHGVIRASAENHGGRSASPTAPNGDAQRQLLVDVYGRAGVDPRSVDYIEAHGTGTSLGDPIEVNALKAAFAELHGARGLALPDAPYCGLGSIKTNLGHLEAAAGVTGLIKVLLMLRHRMLPGNPHLREPNPYLQLDGTPFYLLRDTRDWPARRDEQGRTLPRRAGVSSFGVGGSNAHVVVEEYVPAVAPARAQTRGAPVAIVLSARSDAQLDAAAAALLRAVERAGDALALDDLALTLQVGREAMPYRLAFAAASLDEVACGLRGGAAEGPLVRRGRVDHQGDDASRFGEDEDVATLVRTWAEKGKLDKLLAAWVDGVEVDWTQWPRAASARRIALPTYPFARERYWIPGAPEAAPATPEVLDAPDASGVAIFEEVWVEEAAPSAPGGLLGVVACFVDDASHRAVLETQLRALDADARLVFIEAGDTTATLSDTHYRIVRSDPRAYAQTFAAVRARFGALDAVLYLWPLDDARWIVDVEPVLHLLQAVDTSGAKPRKVILSGAYADALERCHLDAWIAFERSLDASLPDTQVAVMFRASAAPNGAAADTARRDWARLLGDALRAPRVHSAHHADGRRRVPRLAPVALEAGAEIASAAPIRQRGVYLITGGCGGLGMIVATHLASRYGARLVLTGRSAPGPASARCIETLTALGGSADYVQADAADAAAMRAAVTHARQRHGGLDGVFHVAGVAGAAELRHARPDAFRRVLEAKIAGTRVLDAIADEHALDFLCCFSSSSAVLGDFGSCDYALGNRFQTVFMAARDRARGGGARRLAINWPLWRDGGLRAGDAEQTAFYLSTSGQRALPSDEGVALLERLLAQDGAQYLVLAGQPERLRRIAAAAGGGAPPPPAAAPPPPPPTNHPPPPPPPQKKKI